MARGINRQRIVQEDADRYHWRGLLSEVTKRFKLRLHAYALLDNHYHLILETTEKNLSRAMQWLQVSYSMWYNRRHGRLGPLFQGRFRSVVVEDGKWAYELSLYVHLNPLRLGQFRLSKKGRGLARRGVGPPPSREECRQRLQRLRDYRWSSYRAYAGYERAPAWLTTEILQGRAGGIKEYCRFVQGLLREGVNEGTIERLRDRFAVGSEAFRGRIHAFGREKGREISGRGDLKQHAPFEEVVKAAERLTGENLTMALKRRGSMIKPLVMWAGRKLCGLTLQEIGKRLGGMDYNAVNMALHRWEAKIKDEPSATKVVKQLQEMCNV
jgi:REP element-mobilizing transposase RayT